MKQVIEQEFVNTLNIQSIIRTSAILWSDELGTTKTDTIQRKLIESIFVLNGNIEISIEELIDNINKLYKLNFSEEEIINIIDSSKDSFECNPYQKSLCLTNKKYKTLSEKDDSFNTVLQNFCNLYPEYKDKNVLGLIQKYFYELLNTNIKAYLYILKPNKYPLNGAVIDSKQFSEDEIDLINTFITWNDKDKNSLIFKLISFSIEYSLVSNNSDKNVYYQSLKTKVFYLDSNIIYRAIGINGDFRKQRTQYFLSKCKKAGQSFAISYYTKNEIEKSIDTHIKELSKLSYGKINPDLFEESECNSGFYEFYHKWRKDRASKSLEVFKAFLLTEIDNLYTRFGILVDYRNQVKQTNPRVDKILTQYIKELKDIKKEPNELIVKTDALNMLVLENKRGSNNIGFQDTKYYLLTTDQKLQQWDSIHSENQPLTLLPSHWMGLLLKFISRTDDDYSSFTSFLKIPNNQSLLTPEELENVVTGISEMTEDFQMQSSIMKKMVETKFESILKNRKSSSIRENAISFSKSFLEDVYTQELSVKEQVIEKNSAEFAKKIEEKNNEIKEAKKEALRYRIENIKNKISQFKKTFSNFNDEAKKIKKRRCILSILLFILYFGLLIYLIVKFSWDKMEPITFLGSVLMAGISYIYIMKKGDSFNPVDFFNVSNIEKLLISKANIDLNEYKDLQNELEDCVTKLSTLETFNNAV